MAETTQNIAASPVFKAGLLARKKEPLTLVFWGILGFLAAQRFSLSPLAGVICLLPLAAAVMNFQSNIKRRNALLLLALFWSTDNAVLGYGATIAPIRYLIYATVLLTFVSGAMVRTRTLTAMLIVVVFYLMMTMFVSDHVSILQLGRDLQILFLLALLFCFKKRQAFVIDIPFLMITMTMYLLSECMNFFVFGSVWHGEYMSFDSTKYLVVLPSLVALLARRASLALPLFGLTILVLVGYSSRSLFIVYLLCVPIIFLFFTLRGGLGKRLAAIAILVVSMMLLAATDYTSTLEQFKALNVALIIQSQGAAALEVLDPVRYSTSALYFQLPVLELLFGRGLGSGLVDKTGLFSFVSPDQAAFSLKELSTGYFYNFHDFWVDIGLRFGLLPLSAFILWFSVRRPAQSREGNALWLLVFIGINAAFFSFAGLISVFFLMRIVLDLRDREKTESLQPPA